MCTVSRYLNALVREVGLFCHSQQELDCQLCGETSHHWSHSLVSERFSLNYNFDYMQL